MAYIQDANYVPTVIRGGNAVGGLLAIDVSTMTAGTWYRLMPGESIGTITANRDNRVGRTAARADILDATGWNFLILNKGYQGNYKIKEITSAYVTLTTDINHVEGLRAAGLSAQIEYVMYPDIINPFAVILGGDSSEGMEIGVIADDTYSPAAGDVKPLIAIAAGGQAIFNFSRIDRLFYRFATLPSADTTVSWGEHYVS